MLVMLAIAATTATTPKVGVAPTSSNDLRTKIELATRSLGNVDVQPREYVDRVAADLAASGLSCSGLDDACWSKFAVNAGIDVVIAGELDDRGSRVTLHAVGTHGAAIATASGEIGDVDALVRSLFAPHDAAPASPPAVAPVTKPAGASSSTAPPHASTQAPPKSSDGASSAAAWGIASGVSAGVAAACGVVAGVLELQADANIESWKSGGTINGGDQKIADAAEIGFGVCAAGALAAAAGTGVVALTSE